MRLSSSIVALSLAAGAMLAAPAVAQRGGGGGDTDDNPTITLYDQAGFGGRSITLDGDAPDLRWVQFNDLTTSYRFSGGRWEVCLEPNYRGACHLVDADNENMAAWAFNNRITSVRALHRPDRDRRRGITLFSGPNYTGQSVHIRDTEYDLRDIRFDNQANSIEVHSGTWTLCENADFSGRCVEFSRDSNNLQLFRMDRRVSAASPDGIPQPQPAPSPGYGPGYGDGYGPGYGGSGAVRGVNSLFLPTPGNRGYPIAFCMRPSEQNCGDRVARQICRAEGYNDAVHFDARRARGPLWFIGAQRAERGRDEIVDVLCVR
jgi:hypothetical protein